LDGAAFNPATAASSISPEAIVSPGSAEEVAAILKLANQRGFTVAPLGIPSQPPLPSPQAVVVLSSRRLKAVQHFDPGDLTVGVGSGTTVDELNAMLAPHHLMFAVNPPCPESATVGGVLATAAHGPLRHGFGAVRDQCIGIRFVTGDGRIGKGGGRVVKNVAGYDLMKLLIGSWGTLAVITSASFKLFPGPRQTRTFVAEFKSWQEALAFRDFVSKSPLAPMCLELASPGARSALQPSGTKGAWAIFVRAAGSDAVLARYRKELGSTVTRELDGADETRLWRALANFPIQSEESLERDWSRRLCAYSYLSIFAPSTEIGSVLSALDENGNPDVATIDVIGRVGVGHLLIYVHVVDMDFTEAIVIDDLRRRLPPAAQVINDRRATASASMRAVKRALDPNDILNRGRFAF
jgi:glycolate oxidase FAD binding subunit